MKGLFNNSTMRFARMLLTGLLFAVAFGSLVGYSEPDPMLTYIATTLSFVGGIVISSGYSFSERRGMAFMACGAISSAIAIDCADPLVAGVDSTIYIANKADILSYDFDPANGMLCDLITMVTLKKFFTVQGQLQSAEPKFAMIKGKYTNQCEHEVGFLIFKVDPATKKEILAMKDGNFVVIIKNNYTGTTATPGNCKYEVYGLQAGLKAEVIERNPNDTENLGAYKINLKTQEYARESKPPVTLFATDLATTETLITTLTT